MWIDTKSLSLWLNPLKHRDALDVIKDYILDDLIPKSMEANSKVMIQIGKYTMGLEHIILDIAKYIKRRYNMKLCAQKDDIDILKI